MFNTTSLHALRGGRSALAGVFRATPAQHRLFSSTQSRQASKIIHFTKCSTPELDQTLQTIRSEFILPKYLPKELFNKIYKPKYKDALERDPITVEIDGETVQFGPRDMMKMPNTARTVSEAICQMKTPGDFHNLRPLLEGVCDQAGRLLPLQVLMKAMRRAANADCLTMIMDCVKAAKRTRFRLNRHELAVGLMGYIQRQAIFSGWKEEEIERAMRRTQLVLDLLETDPEHRKKADKVTLAFPLHLDPIILAARLHMQAAFAIKHQKGKDTTGLVNKYAQQLVQLWPRDAGLLELQPETSYTKGGVGYLRKLWQNSFQYGGLVLSSLRLGAKVAEPKLAEELNARADNVERLVNEHLPKVQEWNSTHHIRRTHELLFGPESLLADTVKA